MRLIHYTWKRTVHTKTAAVVLLILAFLSCWYGLDSAGYLTAWKYADLSSDPHASTVGETARAVGKVFAAHHMDYSAENYSELLAEYDSLYQTGENGPSESDWSVPGKYAKTILEDRWVFSAILTQSEHYEQTAKKRAAMLRKAETLQANALQNSYAVREAADAAAVYSRSSRKPLYHAETAATAATSLFDIPNSAYAYDSIVLIAAVCILCAGLIANDRRNGALQMLYTTEHCGGRLFYARLFTAFGIALLCQTVSAVTALSVYVIRDGGFQGLNAPLQTVASMYGDAYADLGLCPFAFSVLGYLIGVFAMRTLALCCFAALTLLCSAWLENRIAVTFFGCGFSVGLFVIQLAAQTDRSAWLPIFRIWNPAALFWGTQYYLTYDAVCFAGYPVQRIFPAICAALTETAILALLAFISDRRRRHG